MPEPGINNQPLPNGTWRGVNQFDRTHRASELTTIFDLLAQTPPRAAVARDIECHPTVKRERNEFVRGRIPAGES